MSKGMIGFMCGRFQPSKYASHTHDTKTDKHYYVTDEHIGCNELFDEIERLEKENSWNSEQIMKRDNLINDLLKENYMLQCEMFEDFEEYLEKDFKKRKEAFEVD